MIGNEKRSVLCRWGSVLIFTLLLMLGLAVSYDVYYDLNDDTAIKDIISGTFTGTPSGYSIQMLYPLSWVLAVLYTAIPGVAWYGLFLCMCQFGALALIAWRLLEITGNKRWWFVLLVVEGIIAIGLLLRYFVFVQYSVTSAMCMMAAIFWYTTSAKTNNWLVELKQNAVAILFLWISFQIRTELCVMLLPFLCVAGLIKWSTEEKIFEMKQVKKYLSLIMTALAGMLLFYMLDACAYRLTDWTDFRAFFDARTEVYDFYGIPSYQEHETFYQTIGLTEASYELLINYNFSLDENINTQMMESIDNYHKEQAKAGQGLYSVLGFPRKQSPREALWCYKEYLMSKPVYLVYAAYMLYFLLACGRKKSGWSWKLLLLFTIRSVLWLYLFMVDRAIERVTLPLVLGEFAVLIGWVIQEFKVQYAMEEGTRSGLAKKLTHVKLCGAVMILLLCGIVCVMINATQTGQEYEKRLVANARWDALIAYCEAHKDGFYSVDVYSSTSYQGAAYSEKIFQDVNHAYRNFDICGGWAAKSPLMYDKLSKADIVCLETDFISSEKKLYFVAASDRQIDWLKTYYETKGHIIQMDIVDTIYANGQKAFDVYQLSIVNN